MEEWLSIKKYLPPLNVLVLTKDGDRKSAGRVTDFVVGNKAKGGEKTLSLTWSSVEPHSWNPTHWMHMPD